MENEGLKNEKKIRDLTGNQEEKIAPKSADRDRGARPAMKRPQVRMAQEASQTDDRAHGRSESEERSGARRFDRGGKKNRGDRKREQQGQQTRPAQREEAEKQERPSEQGKRGKNGKNRDDRRRNDARKDDARRNEKRRSDGRSEGQKAHDKHPEHTGQTSGQSDRGDRGVSNARRRRDTATELSAEPFRRNEAGGEQPEVAFTDEELRADGLLFMLDEPEAPETETGAEAAQPEEPHEQFEVIGIRFRGAGKIYYFSPNGITFVEGDHAVLETVRGMEYGEVAHGNRMVDESEVVQPLKSVLRKATEEDDAHYLANLEREQKARPIFEEKVSKNRLEMQLVDVEYTFDNTKLCFYFTAEGRVDFRELVKDLASVFRTRIELRQIGVRDEARMFGGLGVCGRPFCCKSFLSDFVQVSIKMAKEQNLSLASAKISGSCGRLMCCLRYEQDTYERENALLPRPNSIVSTPKGRATVLESSFLTGTVKVLLTEENAVRVFSTAEVKLLEAPRAKGGNNRAQNDAEAAAVAAVEESAEENSSQENA